MWEMKITLGMVFLCCSVSENRIHSRKKTRLVVLLGGHTSPGTTSWNLKGVSCISLTVLCCENEHLWFVSPRISTRFTQQPLHNTTHHMWGGKTDIGYSLWVFNVWVLLWCSLVWKKSSHAAGRTINAEWPVNRQIPPPLPPRLRHYVTPHPSLDPVAAILLREINFNLTATGNKTTPTRPFPRDNGYLIVNRTQSGFKSSQIGESTDPGRRCLVFSMC